MGLTFIASGDIRLRQYRGMTHMRWKPKDNTKWHKWFAWHPVECLCGTHVWLETVWRKEVYEYVYIVYEERPDITENV